MVAGQHLSRGQDQFAIGLEVGLALVFVQPAQVGHVGHQRHLSIVRQDLGHGGHGVGRAEEPDLPCRHRHVLEDGTRLLDDRLLVDGVVVEDLGRIPHQDGGDDGQWVGAHGGDRGHVACNTAGAAGVADVEAHHASRRRCFLPWFQGFGRVVGVGIHWALRPQGWETEAVSGVLEVRVKRWAQSNRP